MKTLSPKLYRCIWVNSRGEITISSDLSNAMNIQNGDKVSIMYSDYEMYISKSDNGFVVRNSNEKSRRLRFYCKDAAKMLLGNSKCGTFRIGENIEKDGMMLFTIIYKKNYAKTNQL